MVNLVKALGNATSLVVLAVIAWLFMWYRLDLHFGDAILCLMAFTLVTYCMWLGNHGAASVAKKLVIPAFIILGIVTFRHLAPGTAKLAETGAQEIDSGSAQSAEVLETPQEVPCKPPYFIGKEGKPKFWYAPSQEKVACYNRAGFHPVTREPLKEVPRSIAAAIEANREQQIEMEHRQASAAALARPKTVLPPPASAPTPPPQELVMDSNSTRDWPAPIKMKDLRKRQEAQHQE